MSEKFLVQVKFPDDPEIYSRLMTASEIISRVDMHDYYDEDLEVYRINGFGKVEKLRLFGTWHNFDEPLLIKAEDKNGNVVFSGYGTDH